MRWLWRFLTRSTLYKELSDEIQQHLDEKIDELISEGMAREQAVAAARRSFGNITLSEERGRDAWGWRWLEDFLADARFGARQLIRNPVVAVICILTLALGVGANVAIFSAVYAVLLRPLPFKDAGRLVLVNEYRAGNIGKTGSPFVRYLQRAQHNDVFDASGGYWDVSGGNEIVFGDGSIVERARFSIVTSSFFPLLGVQPALGRAFSAKENQPGTPRTFLASYKLWSERLGNSADAIGKVFRLDGEPYTLIGVLPQDFNFPISCDIWMPIGVLGEGFIQDRVSHQFWMIARLRPGASVERAQTEMDVIQNQLANAYPASDANWGVTVRPLLDDIVGDVRRSLWVLLGAVGFLLLIACTNVVNLLLARAVSREQEFAIRSSIGAGRLRLLRQLFAESLIIAASGAGVSLFLGKFVLQVLARVSEGSIPRFEHPELSVAAFAFCCGLALLATLLVGAAPGFHASRVDSAISLGSGQRSTVGSRRANSLRNLMVVSQVACTLLLLSGAGLMLRSLVQLRRIDPGFDPRHLISMKIALPDALYPRTEQRTAFLRELLNRLNAIPGIMGASATDRLPLSGERNWGAINIAGRLVLDPAHAPSVEGRSVSAGYFRTLGVRLLRGRVFSARDVAEARHVTVINQTMANQFWPGTDPIGQRISSAYHPDSSAEVVGVVENVKEFGLGASAPPEMYSPYQWWSVMNLLIRGTGDSAGLLPTVRHHVAALDSQVPVYEVRTMDEVVNRSLARLNFEFLLLSAFAFLALLLASVGIYGLMVFMVSTRTAELGLRLALGASPSALLEMVVAQGMKLILFGTVLGVLMSITLSRVLGTLLVEVKSTDPLTLAATAMILVVVGAVAIVIPARRALHVDPLVTLRVG
jgi:putative ABC transport system permease protein